jgi:hypothetical protein
MTLRLAVRSTLHHEASLGAVLADLQPVRNRKHCALLVCKASQLLYLQAEALYCDFAASVKCHNG